MSEPYEPSHPDPHKVATYMEAVIETLTASYPDAIADLKWEVLGEDEVADPSYEPTIGLMSWLTPDDDENGSALLWDYDSGWRLATCDSHRTMNNLTDMHLPLMAAPATIAERLRPVIEDDGSPMFEWSQNPILSDDGPDLDTYTPTTRDEGEHG